MVLLMIFRPGGLASSGVPKTAEATPIAAASTHAQAVK
jgi:hypothetical protein